MSGSGQIPWTAIHAYAEAQGVEDLDYLTTVIRAMDRAYLRHLKRQREDSDNG